MAKPKKCKTTLILQGARIRSGTLCLLHYYLMLSQVFSMQRTPPAIWFLVLTICAIQSCYAGGIQIGRTRIIYDSDKREVALPIINTEKESPWLVQSWTDTGDGKTRGPFIVTPPLFRLDAQKEQSLRISWSGVAVPQDRESLFYMNVRTIPASEKGEEDKNTLKLIFKTRLKLFYRPKGLEGTLFESCKGLSFHRQGNTLQVNNQGLYHTVFDTLSLGKMVLKKADMVLPKSSAEIEIPSGASGQQVSWRCITDYGNASEKFDAMLK